MFDGILNWEKSFFVELFFIKIKTHNGKIFLICFEKQTKKSGNDSPLFTVCFCDLSNLSMNISELVYWIKVLGVALIFNSRRSLEIPYTPKRCPFVNLIQSFRLWYMDIGQYMKEIITNHLVLDKNFPRQKKMRRKLDVDRFM